MTKKEYPILEFDKTNTAFIRPQDRIRPIDISSVCVICFFSEAIEKIINTYPHRVAAYFEAEPLKLPVYELEYKGKKIEGVTFIIVTDTRKAFALLCDSFYGSPTENMNIIGVTGTVGMGMNIDEAPGVSMEMKGTVAGEIKVDGETGWVSESNIVNNFGGEMMMSEEAAGTTMTMSMEIETTITDK